MRKMSTFTPILLTTDSVDPDYLAAIAAARRWAGPHVHFGAADQFVTGEENEFLLHELVIKRFESLDLVATEMYGCSFTYTAETSSATRGSGSGSVEALRMHMSIEPLGFIWITGMSVVERDSSLEPEWEFQLTPQARELATAAFFKKNGVNPGLDIMAFAGTVEAEGRRLAARA
jgi:hypothetical protein